MMNPSTKMNKPYEMAEEFARVLREWLTADEMREVIKRNKVEPSPFVCHSHDYCDANMAMAEAFEHFGIEVDPEDEEQCRLWNAAWDIAKAKEFAIKT